MPDDPAPPLSPEVEAFLAKSGRSFFVTQRADGSPTAHPMTALFSGGRLVYNTYRKSVKARNAQRDPRTCSLLLADYEETSEHALVYKGSARPVDPASLGPGGLPTTPRARARASSVAPSRANARLQEGKRILLGIDAEQTVLLGRGGEG